MLVLPLPFYMCGIAGFYDPDIDDPELVKRMGERIRYRGPDESGTFVQSGVHLQHQRLSIVDLNQGQQPMAHPESGSVVVYNGEIYNHTEIRENHLPDSPFRTRCDTEVLLHAYERWGTRLTPYLNGMFAFCLYSPESQSLFLSRDRLGQKPLYYVHQGRRFAFASELPALLELPWVEKKLDPTAIGQYFSHEHVPCPRTPFVQIKKLPPGHQMVFDLENGELKIERWWKPSFIVDPQYQNAGRALEAFEHHWQRALKYRMMSDVPLGIFLSGGLDSSSCLATLTESFPDQRLKTFSIGFENKSFDESNYARLMAGHCQSDHHEGTLTPEAMLKVLPSIEANMLDPIADASIIPTTLLCQHAKQNVTVAIGGDAADELLCGYPTFNAHYALGSRRWPKSVVKLLQKMAGMIPTSMDNLSLDFKIKQTLSGLSYHNPIRNEVWLGGTGPDNTGTLLPGINSADLSENMLYGEDMRIWAESDSSTFIGKIQDLYLGGYLTDGILTKVDRASMFNSLEVRSPFMDVNLIEFFGSLPISQKMNLRKGKLLLRRAMERRLPHDIIHRPKKGFGMPISHWFRSQLKDDLYQRIQDAPPFFDKAFLKNRFFEHQRGEADNRKILFPYFMFYPVLKAGGTL